MNSNKEGCRCLSNREGRKIDRDENVGGRVALLCFVLTMGVFLVCQGLAQAAPLTVDSAGGVGAHSSLRVVDGRPAISYFDDTNGALKYVRASDAAGSAWGVPVTVDSAGVVGVGTSLCVVDGNPAVSYYDWTNQDLKYVRAMSRDGSFWYFEGDGGDGGCFIATAAYRSDMGKQVEILKKFRDDVLSRSRERP